MTAYRPGLDGNGGHNNHHHHLLIYLLTYLHIHVHVMMFCRFLSDVVRLLGCLPVPLLPFTFPFTSFFLSSSAQQNLYLGNCNIVAVNCVFWVWSHRLPVLDKEWICGLICYIMLYCSKAEIPHWSGSSVGVDFCCKQHAFNQVLPWF